LQTFRRQLRRLARSPRGVIDYARYRRALQRRDWAALHRMLRPLSQSALRLRDHQLLVELGYAALRLDEPQLGVEFLHAARGDSRKPADWRGEPVPDGTLIVRIAEKASQGLAVGLDSIGHIRAAAARAGRTVVIVEPRMVPLFQRTLPEVTVLPFGAELGPYVQGKAVETDVNDLKFLIGYDADTVRRLNVPMVADPADTAKLRDRYRRGRSIPLVGVSWSSTHYGKDLPALEHWAQLIAGVPARFVSLQYGDIADEVAVLNGGVPDRLLVDPEIDQLKDMDSFASQIAALDLVVSISNSGAHLAGALGQRMILVRDDLFRRNWSYVSGRVPWYPRTLVIGKDGRPWSVAFGDIIAEARKLIGANS
jgi:hypothetical protein